MFFQTILQLIDLNYIMQDLRSHLKYEHDWLYIKKNFLNKNKTF